MDTKPSEGPWTVQERLSGSENHRGFLIRDVSGFVVAEVYPRDQDGNEGRANAQRIAASLDLLEALQMASRYVSGEGADDEIQQVDAAIARATGAA